MEKIKVKVGGKFKFSSLPSNIKDKIKNSLAEKDSVIAAGFRGELPGIKIDGKVVTKDNIYEFEKKSEVKKEGVESEVIKVEKKLYKKEDLEKLSLTQLKIIGDEFGTTDRSKNKLIKEILKLQGGN